MNKYESMGFVSIDDIMNVFVEKQRALEETVLADCPTLHARGEKTYVIEHVETIRQELMKRARANLKAYLEDSPAVKREQRAEKAQATAERNKQLHQERASRMGRHANG